MDLETLAAVGGAIYVAKEIPILITYGICKGPSDYKSAKLLYDSLPEQVQHKAPEPNLYKMIAKRAWYPIPSFVNVVRSRFSSSTIKTKTPFQKYEAAIESLVGFPEYFSPMKVVSRRSA